MRMRRFLTATTLSIAGWCAFVATILVCGLGLYLTVLQYRSVRSSLLDSHRRSASSEIEPLRRFLSEHSERVLERVSHARDDRAALDEFVHTDPVVLEPFFVLGDGRVHVPRVPQANASRYLPDASRPQAFDVALRTALGEGALAERTAALEALASRDDLAARWRLRALVARYALELREGSSAVAAKGFGRIIREFSETVRSGSEPSYLQLVLAQEESFRRAGQEEPARELLHEALRELDEERFRVPIDERVFFFRRVRKVLDRTEGTSSSAEATLQRVEERTAEERRSLAIAELLAEWLGANPPSTTLEFPSPPQQFSQEISTQPVLVTWRFVKRSGVGRAEVVGCRLDLDGLRRLFNERLKERTGGVLPLAVAVSPTAESFISLTPLSDSLRFVQVGLPTEEWERLEAEARRPFVTTGALLLLLALVLCVGLVVFLRSARSEMLLSRHKTEFVANVSHELKTPLALIRLFGETLMLGRVSDADRRRQYYEIITRESERLSQLISNVLSFSSIEAGKKTYDRKLCQVDEIVRETFDHYRFELDDKGFTHELVVEPNLPPTEADPDAVAQAFINLLQNAVKYSEDDKQVRVSVARDGDELSVAVQDRGRGISPPEQRLVWADYYRTKEARSGGTRGSGLGLSLVRHIMKSHGGRVDLESEPGEGSTFSLVFSLRPQSAPGDPSNGTAPAPEDNSAPRTPE